MRTIGFSTGALARGDFQAALAMIHAHGIRAVELSALREGELAPLIQALDSLGLQRFEFVAFHAPSALVERDERTLATLLRQVAERNLPIVLHPDVIRDFACWRDFDNLLCLENMDRRKSTGRTCDELESLFAALPNASWCFDIGHASQVDPTMSEATRMLYAFRGRLKHLHASTVNTVGKHEPLTLGTGLSFQRVLHLIPAQSPIILESCIRPEEINVELARARAIFGNSHDSAVRHPETVERRDAALM
jgi:hypothetical protein